MTRDGYDIFLSLAGPDREAVRELVAVLRGAGLRVFFDEDDVGYFTGITSEIDVALRSSKTLVAYYSAAFPLRSACQFELTAAFLAGQREGDPCRRIMVVNPEKTEGHLQPVELSDARFAVMPAPRDAEAMGQTVARIRDRVRATPGVIGGTGYGDRPPWYAERVPGAYGFVGRYRDQWALHSALRDSDFALTQEGAAGPLALVTGMPGIGKTAVAAAYAWQFGAAHLGGVYWVSLAGAGVRADAVRAMFASKIDAVARRAGIAVDGAEPEQALALFAEHLTEQPEPSLVVVDDVPPDLGPDALAGLVLVGGTNVRTVLVSSRYRHDGPLRAVTVGPMTGEDAVALLRRHREPATPDDVEALERIARLLDGHPYALNLAGTGLRGAPSCAAYADRLESDPRVLSPVTALFRAAVGALDTTQRLLLQVFAVCGPAAVPAAFVHRVAAALSPADAGTVGAALVDLADRQLASRRGTGWTVHTLVRDAAREYVEPVRPLADVARAVAAAVLAADVEPADLDVLMAHAGALVSMPDLPGDMVETLLRRLVGYHEPRGEPVLAMPFRRQLADRHPDDPSELLAAARTHHAAGEHEAATDYAERALELTGDAHLRHDCWLVTAEALDALGRFDEADPIWRDLTVNEPSAGRLATRVAVIRSMRIRGRSAEAEHATDELLAVYAYPPDDDEFHHVEAARLELAEVQLATDDQQAARTTAATVLRHYQERGLPNHAQAVHAQQVFAQAQLALPLWELRPDHRKWTRAELALRQLHDGLRRSHGRTNLVTLTAAVAHAQALVSLGKRELARERLGAILPDIVRRCGDRHPLAHQSRFLLGQAHAQLGDYRQAKGCYQAAFEGQQATLGPTHPQTLATQFELGVTMKMTGDGKRAKEMFRAVLKAAPTSVGTGTDLYARALFACGLVKLPTWLWRRLAVARPVPDDPT